MSALAGELIHATALVISDRGIIITGASGSGKSSIANALIDRASASAQYATLISDDQCLLQAVSGRLLCTTPETLRGGLEVRGSGLHQVAFEPRAVIHLLVHLVEPAQAPRMHENTIAELQGVAITQLKLPAGEVESACRSIEAWLFKPEWKK
ncbi:serine kinase of the HPr protein, regulates carbohydrate metabolism [Phyllobacterium sp. YR531]|uniref:HPr kinase/phosphorylase n=1 Tax=Phyllobacterium sp. YR531 TaxID=1144343 RepID=UPI00026FCC90|nr:serine kinase of the HPr protein, regulates carbohydrate metabolism [Phyllobacterium sp. YR531]EJM99921.1 serine kinase of the HPr protein, regulates carbohydrate metabolism [Phyllobacterium sp. YR531]